MAFVDRLGKDNQSKIGGKNIIILTYGYDLHYNNEHMCVIHQAGDKRLNSELQVPR